MSDASAPSWRARPPAAGEPLPFRFPAFTRRRLANGFELLLAPVAQVPLVELEVLLPAGGQHAPPGRAGLPSFHAQLLDEGTAELDALDVARRIETTGGSIGSGADWNVASVAASALAEHLEQAFALLVEVVRRPSFPDAEIERQRRQRQAEILRQREQPRSLAERAFLRRVYGDGVYGTPLIGTAESLAAIDRETLLAFYRGHVTPRGATLIAVGDFDPDRFETLAAAAFGDWRAAEPPPPPRIEPVPLEATAVVIVDRPGAAQTQLFVGHAGVPRGAPGYPARVLLNAVFGGSFTSRLNLNLRERHGFTYGVRSAFVRRQGPGPFVVETAVGNAVAGRAVAEIVSEMRRIRDRPVGDRELAETRDFLTDVFPYTLQTLDGVVHRLEQLVVYDLGDDYYRRFPAVLAEVEPVDVHAAARELFHPDRLAIVAVGPAAELRPRFERFGPVEVIDPDDR